MPRTSLMPSLLPGVSNNSCLGDFHCHRSVPYAGGESKPGSSGEGWRRAEKGTWRARELATRANLKTVWSPCWFWKPAGVVLNREKNTEKERTHRDRSATLLPLIWGRDHPEKIRCWIILVRLWELHSIGEAHGKINPFWLRETNTTITTYGTD